MMQFFMLPGSKQSTLKLPEDIELLFEMNCFLKKLHFSVNVRGGWVLDLYYFCLLIVIISLEAINLMSLAALVRGFGVGMLLPY